MTFWRRVGLALMLGVIMVSIDGGPEWLDSQRIPMATLWWIGCSVFVGWPDKKQEMK